MQKFLLILMFMCSIMGVFGMLYALLTYNEDMFIFTTLQAIASLIGFGVSININYPKQK
jgi:hypothetical protein